MNTMDDLTEEDLQNPLLSGIEVGDSAPEFSMKNACNDDPEIITLSQEIQQHNGVLLIFFRGAWWPVWYAFFKRIGKPEVKAEFDKRDVKVIGIAHDSVKSMKRLKFCGYPMIADVTRQKIGRASCRERV